MPQNEPKTEQAARYRTLRGPLRSLSLAGTGAAVLASMVQIFNIVFYGHVMESKMYLGVLMATLIPQVFLVIPAGARSSRGKAPWYDLLAASLFFCCAVYIIIFALDIQLRGWSIRPPVLGLWLGVAAWILVIEAVRRSTGPALAAIVLVVSAYPLIGGFMPGILSAKTYSIMRLVGFHYMSSQSMFGVTTHVFGRLVIAFLIFAVALLVLGGGDFFIRLAISLLGTVRGGGAKVAILGSAIFASISGSPTSNVITTGSFTIPAMKKSGYPAHYAAALEACSSTGGVLMPPVMGVTAFIMADFLEVSYAAVCLAAVIPSLLYFFSLYMQSDFYAAKAGLKGIPREECPPVWRTIREGWLYLVTFGALLYFLFFLRQEARAPYFCVAILIALMMLFRRKAIGLAQVGRFVEVCGRVLCEILTIMVGVGMIIGSFLLTGIAQSFSSSILQMAGDSLLLLLCMGAVASFVMGIGMTMIPCYIILALLLAPALVEIGVEPMAAHLFILYWGMISFITPPVAIASIVAAGLAETDNMKTGIFSLRLGFVAYVIPFFFIYNPMLVGIGSLWAILYTTLSAALGIVLLSAGVEGFLFRLGRLGWVSRGTLSLLGLLFFFPEPSTDLWGAVGLVAFIGISLVRKKKAERGQAPNRLTRASADPLVRRIDG